MDNTKETRINGHRVALGVIIFLLAAICLIQTSSVSCSSNKGDSADGSDENSATVDLSIEDSEKDDSNVEDSWVPISEGVMEQIQETYKDRDFTILGMDKSSTRSSVVRCTLEARESVSPQKQLLDCMFIMYSTYPSMKRYVAYVPGSKLENFEVDWDTLGCMKEAGYSFDMPESDAMSVWDAVFMKMNGDGESDNDSTSLNAVTS